MQPQLIKRYWQRKRAATAPDKPMTFAPHEPVAFFAPDAAVGSDHLATAKLEVC